MQSVIFFGSDMYSAIVFAHLVKEGYSPRALVTTSASNPLVTLAIKHNVNVFNYPPRLDELSNYIDSSTTGVSVSFGRILPSPLLALFPRAVLNLHPSLLPQYRNVAPVPYALAMGDSVTGITLFRMDEKIDNGQILAQVEEPILATDTTPVLLRRLFQIGSALLSDFLAENPIRRKTDSPKNRFADSLIFTRKLTRESGFIEWTVLQKLLKNEKIKSTDTQNELIRLRLTHHPARTQQILPDLIRALAGYEQVWTIAPTPKGDLRVNIVSPKAILIPGKPRSILYTDFAKYYL